MAGSFLGAYGVLDIDTAGHWTYRAGETRLRELKENGPEWFTHFDRFLVTREDGSVQTITITLCRRHNDEAKETTAFKMVSDRVPAETFGENNEPNLILAAAWDFTRKRPNPDLFDWAEKRERENLPLPARRIANNFGLSPRRAVLVAQLAGLRDAK